MQCSFLCKINIHNPKITNYKRKLYDLTFVIYVAIVISYLYHKNKNYHHRYISTKTNLKT